MYGNRCTNIASQQIPYDLEEKKKKTNESFQTMKAYFMEILMWEFDFLEKPGKHYPEKKTERKRKKNLRQSEINMQQSRSPLFYNCAVG